MNDCLKNAVHEEFVENKESERKIRHTGVYVLEESEYIRRVIPCKCFRCGAQVFFVRPLKGGNFYCEELGGAWTKHLCFIRNIQPSKYSNNFAKKEHFLIRERSKSNGTIKLNMKVDVYFECDDKLRTIKLIAPGEVKTDQNSISTESPLGKNLLGKKEGDDFYYKVSTCLIHVMVFKVHN